MIPNLQWVVEQAKEDYPVEWARAHHGGPGTEDFIKICAAQMHAINHQFGLNGKRGDKDDLSDDCVNFVGEGPGRTPEGYPCQVIDVIGSAGGPDAYPTWQLFTNPQEASGAWVLPGVAPEPEPPVPPKPEPPPLKSRDQFYADFRAVNDYYAAPEGLKRPGGMVIDSASPVRCDVEAMGKWGYDLMTGKTVDQCKAEIRQSDEWRQKHPGETP